MPLNTLTDQLVHDMQDLWSAEREMLDQLPQLHDAAQEPRLRETLAWYQPVVARHVDELDQLIRERSADPGCKPCQSISALAEANEHHLLPADADAAVKDAALVGALTRMQYYKLAGYRCLLTYAQHLEAKAEADFFRAAISDERACLSRLSEAELLAVERAED